MNCTRDVRSILLISILYCAFGLTASAGEVVEEFDSPELQAELWEIQTAGKASFEIKDGQLIMESFAIEDGILLRYVPEITGQDITFEFKFDTSEGAEPNAQIWFAETPLVPAVNTEVNTHWMLVETIWEGNTYVKDAVGKVIQDVPVEDGPNVYKLVLEGNDVTLFVNGKEAGSTARPDGVSYFHIGPDMYTSHYGSRIGILDYVKISGPDVHPLAVEPMSKCAVTWGKIKNLPGKTL